MQAPGVFEQFHGTHAHAKKSIQQPLPAFTPGFRRRPYRDTWLRKQIAKLSGFYAIQTRLAFVDDVDNAKREKRTFRVCFRCVKPSRMGAFGHYTRI